MLFKAIAILFNFLHFYNQSHLFDLSYLTSLKLKRIGSLFANKISDSSNYSTSVKIVSVVHFLSLIKYKLFNFHKVPFMYFLLEF